MSGSSYVEFHADADARRMILRQPWTGEWPPPARMGLLFGKGSMQPHNMITDPKGEQEARDHVAAQGVDFDERFTVIWYALGKHSKIPDADIAEMTHVARGAQYIPEVP